VLVYICVWLPYLGLRFYTTYVLHIYEGEVGHVSGRRQQYFTKKIAVWQTYTNTSTVFTGLLMSVIRLRRASMWNTVKAYLRCRKVSEVDLDQNDEIFGSSLNESLV
jgi:hypothetical protein